MSQYYRYHIKLTNEGSRIWVQVRDPEGNEKNPVGDCNLSEIPSRISDLSNKVQRGKASPTEMEELGEELFKALFSPEIATDFRNLLTQVNDTDIDKNQKDIQPEPFLRLELDLDEHELPAVAALPWEFLRVPQTAGQKGSNLGTHSKIALSRRRDLWDYTKPIIRTEPLRIQLVISEPKDKDLGPVVYEEVEDAIKTLAQKHPDLIASPLESLHEPTLKKVNQILEEQKPDILHFIGHGRLRRKAKGTGFGELALVGSGNTPDWCNAKQIGDLFEEHRPAVVILQACESGAEGLLEAFTGVASQVVQSGVPVVVAMQYSIDNNAAVTFVEDFYHRLGQFKPVDVAIQRGRRLLKQEFKDIRAFAAPVLFMRAKDGQLFSPNRRQDATTSEQGVAANSSKIQPQERKDSETTASESVPGKSSINISGNVHQLVTGDYNYNYGEFNITNVGASSDEKKQRQSVQEVIVGNNNEVIIRLKNGQQKRVPFIVPLTKTPYSLIGRNSLLQHVKHDLLLSGKAASLVLSGEAGVGKTAMALELAYDEEVLKYFDDGVLWTTMGPHANPSKAINKWLSALGLSDGITDPTRFSLKECARRLKTLMSTRRMLLIVDDVQNKEDAYWFTIGGPQCSLLLTTPKPFIATEYAKKEHIIALEKLSMTDSLLLIKEFVPELVNEEYQAIKKLIDLSGNLPHALVLMGKYLQQESDSQQSDLIRDAFDDLYGYLEKGNLISALSEKLSQ